jgi:hypothetical protein
MDLVLLHRHTVEHKNKVSASLLSVSLFVARSSKLVAHNVWRPDFRAGLKQPTLNQAQTYFKDNKLSFTTFARLKFRPLLWAGLFLVI